MYRYSEVETQTMPGIGNAGGGWLKYGVGNGVQKMGSSLGGFEIQIRNLISFPIPENLNELPSQTSLLICTYVHSCRVQKFGQEGLLHIFK